MSARFTLSVANPDGLLVVYLADSASTHPGSTRLSANALKIVHAFRDHVHTALAFPLPETRKKSCSVLPVSQQATAYSVGCGCVQSGQSSNAGKKTGVYLNENAEFRDERRSKTRRLRTVTRNLRKVSQQAGSPCSSFDLQTRGARTAFGPGACMFGLSLHGASIQGR